MQKILLSGVLLLLATGCSDHEQAQKQHVEKVQAALDTDQGRAIVQGCMDSTRAFMGLNHQSNLLSNGEMWKACVCTLSGVLRHYTFEQVQAIDNASDAEKEKYFATAFDQGVICGKQLTATNP